MKLVNHGKTKDLFELENGHYLLKFKDDVTGTDGVFDPGANTVGLTMEGAGHAGLRVTTFFFERLNELGIPTHYVKSDLDENTMEVLPAQVFGKGVEVILRLRAVGSFYRRYGAYLEGGEPLDHYVEVTLKDDVREDPLITKDALVALEIMTAEEYETLAEMTREIGDVVAQELAKKDLELYDIKFEFGRVGEDGHVALIDEISGGNMRAYRGDEYIPPLELDKILLGAE